METKRLEYFVALVDARSFSRAAERLFITQPALSQQIKKLEQEAGANLVDRGMKGFQLTPAGRQLYILSKRILAQVSELTTISKDAHLGLIGRVRVGLVPSALYTGIPNLISAFRVEHEHIEMDVEKGDTTELVTLLEELRLDAIFTYSRPSHTRFEVRDLEPTEHVLAVPIDHPFARLHVIELIDLREEPLLLVKRSGSPEVHDHLVAACTQAGFSPTIIGSDHASYIDQIGFVAAGQGVALLPSRLALPINPRVTFRPLGPPGIDSSLFLVWRREEVDPAIVRFATYCTLHPIPELRQD